MKDKKTLLITSLFLGFLFLPSLSYAANVSSNSCCIYYKPAGPSGQCQVYDPKLQDTVPQTIGGKSVETFACSLYNKSTDRVANEPFPVIGAGMYVYDTNVVGYFQYDSNGFDVPKTCYTVKNYKSEYLSSPLSVYDKNRCEFAANLGTPDSIIFGGDFQEAASSFNSQLEKMELKAKIEQKLESESQNVCCVPIDPSSNKCEYATGDSDKIFVEHDYTKDSLQKILNILQKPFKGGGDTADLDKLNYFSCSSSYKKYPAACNSTATIEKPSSEYTNTPDMATIGTYCSKTEYDPPVKENSEGDNSDEVNGDYKKISALAATELNRIGSTDIKLFLGRAINVIMGVMGSIALAMFVYAGFLFMVSGTTDSVEKARSIMVWSSMGIVVVFASYALVQLIFATF